MKNIFGMILLCFIVSCNDNKLNGKIEFRDEKVNCNPNNQTTSATNQEPNTIQRVVYLVNKSIDKTYEFTVKVTKIINDTTDSYYTIKHELAPGDEEFLSCKEYLEGDKFYTKEVSDTFYYWNEQTKTLGDISKIDTKKLPDSTNPKPQDRIRKIYECTGQRLIKNEKENDKNN